jgi:hypothetical protein
VEKTLEPIRALKFPLCHCIRGLLGGFGGKDPRAHSGIEMFASGFGVVQLPTLVEKTLEPIRALKYGLSLTSIPAFVLPSGKDPRAHSGIERGLDKS